MKSEKVLELSSKLLNMKEDVISDQSSDPKALELMVTALNNVLSEIAEEYVPFLKTEEIVSETAEIPFLSLSETPKEILKVKTAGKTTKFELTQTGIKLKSGGKIEITYSYIPQKVAYGEEFYLPVGITERTLACGVAGEYALMCERYEECVNYDNRFMSGIRSVSRSKKERKLPYWRWI